ncbi:hypothetical protein [Haliangium ochraceum]|uniref:Worm-specific repeat type 1 n=1 Tax=Haliangium ochraceum (strain DSM 14365 / JCM 11303 / SMP-2) TaxID=502025 RepID=D0LGD0_HALO1|nr:hypothetical protein [Haliangium ochraceum]ACY18155.1 Worm-specific repeat type 1 [Haliangium ochraceum DSM 14365]
MNRTALLALALLAGPLAACDLGEVPPPAGAANNLGQVCSGSAPCPTDHTCVTLSFGSANEGYCSPSCTEDLDCSTGYSGPPSGTVFCENPSAPNTCVIACTQSVDCPDGLSCESSGGPVSFCVVPAAQSLTER